VRIAYAGTALFGALVLECLLDRSEHEIGLVVTRPDRPRGRHGTPQPSPVKEAALAAGVPVFQPERLRDEAIDRLAEAGAEVLVVCAHGEILEASLLERMTTLVVHPSALPAWRGPAPVERALMAGETELGVAVLHMTAEVDAGPVGAARAVHVPRDADAGVAFETLARPACEAVVSTLCDMEDGSAVWSPQVGEPGYAPKLERRDREIDWSRPAVTIVDQIRALSPRIGARTEIEGRPLTIWRARVCDELPDDGSSDRLLLKAGEGHVEVLELQAPGGRRQEAASYLRGAGRWLADR